jgi:hypothetical protein
MGKTHILSGTNKSQTEKVTAPIHPLNMDGSLLALSRVRELSLCFPWVILNPVRDDLRMMAPNAVAARDGAMKENRVFWHIMFWNASIKSCLNSLLISCPIDRPLNAG